MKRLTTYLSLFALLLSVGASSVLAAQGGGGGGDTQLPPPVGTCMDYDNCAVYVDDVQFSDEHGSKTEPFMTIAAALTFVKNNADYNTIRIATGLYTDNGLTVTSLSKGIVIQGGYNEGFTELAPGGFPTIVDTNGPGFITVTNTHGSIKGLSIKDSFTGTAIKIKNTSGTNDFTVADNVFNNNKNGSGIGALDMSIEGSNTAVAENNTFYGNVGDDGTAAHFNGGTDNLTIRNNVFYDNNNDTTFYCEDATAYNNYFINNSANDEVIAAEYNCKLYHNTIHKNDAGDATIKTLGSGNEIVSNLLTSNVGGVSVLPDPNDPILFEFNAFYSNSSDPELEQGNKSCNPQYPNENGKTPADLALSASSNCIDKGLNVNEVSEDYYGLTRPANGDGIGSTAADPGAYEVADPGLTTPAISNVNVSPNPYDPSGDAKATISFEISQKAEVNIQWEDVNVSNEKQGFFESVKNAGNVVAEWDGTYHQGGDTFDTPEGVYTMTISAKNSSGTDTEEFVITVAATPEVVDSGTPDSEADDKDDSSNDDAAMEDDKADMTPQEIVDVEEAKATLAKADNAGEKCSSYTDVAANHPDCKALEFVKDKGAMTGNPDGSFAPAAPLQRDQIAKIVLEALGLFDENEDYCQGQNPFPDVTSADWSYQYICRAVDLGLVTGYEAGPDAGKYVPARAVNRAEALALLLRHLESLPTNDSVSFDDVGSGQWFSGYAKFAQDNGLFTGSKLYAGDSTIRLEVADILYKLEQLGKLTTE